MGPVCLATAPIHTYIQLLPLCFHSNSKDGEFLGYVQGLLYKGTILMYNPTMNKAEWAPVHSSVKSLTPMEQASATDLCNMVPCSPTRSWESPQLPLVRLRRFAEDSMNKGSGRDNTSSPQSPHSPHGYSDCYHCHCSWADQCKTKYEDDDGDYTHTHRGPPRVRMMTAPMTRTRTKGTRTKMTRMSLRMSHH